MNHKTLKTIKKIILYLGAIVSIGTSMYMFIHHQMMIGFCFIVSAVFLLLLQRY